MWAAKYVLCALTCVAFATASSNSERKRKSKMDVPEDASVPLELARTLDMSCSAAQIAPPVISHGKVALIDRRRRGKKVFLVAFYACDEEYGFENANNAMFCSNESWLGDLPTCLPKEDFLEQEDEFEEYDTVPNYDNEENDDDENEIVDVEPPRPPPPPVTEGVVEPLVRAESKPEPEIVIHINENEANQSEAGGQTLQEPEVQSFMESEKPTFVELTNETVPTTPKNELPQNVSTENISSNNTSVAAKKDIYEPTLLDNNCGQDNGGCEHICMRLLYPDENEPVQKCNCQKGYTLDPNDYTSCLDIDECQESNGGCSEICENMPGEYKCACQTGYKIDISDGKTCVDIDECANSELSPDCQGGCTNLPGSYRCEVLLEVEVKSPTASEEPTPEVTDIPVNRSCNPGFKLAADGSDCLDINECEEKDSYCQQNCENTIGSFRCSCQEGYHLLEDQWSCALDGCADLQKPELNRTRCAHACEDLPEGSYRCTCPNGYKLSEDGHSCLVDESVVSNEKEIKNCSPGTCSPSEDDCSLGCICPTGYRSDEFGCQDIDECADGSHLCSDSCQNTPGGYQCVCPEGLSLVEEYTCVAEDRCEVNNNGCEQICLTARGGACSCRDGYHLSPNGKSCQDVDECLVRNGGCQQVCRNLPGTHACACERGYELTADKKSCQDVDECAGLLSGGCSHECINKAGTFECGCPLGYVLTEDDRSCRPVLVGCPPGAQRTSEGCVPIDCGRGFTLGSDDKCVDLDECLENNGGCSHRCSNSEGSFKCSCPPGYKLDSDQRTCQDIDECAQDKTSCISGKCVNEIGGFRCEFPKFPDLPVVPSLSELPELPKPDSKKPKYPDFTELSNDIPKSPKLPDFPEFPKREFPSLPIYPPDLPSLPPLGELPTTTSTTTTPSPLPKFPDFPKNRFGNPLQPRDRCPRFQAPRNGKSHCNRYRHKEHRFYNSRCRITCNPGYVLQGPEIKSCGATGIWEGPETKCVAVNQPRLGGPGICPALKPAQNGVIFPPSCTQGPSRFGDVCQVQCNVGFVPTGSFLTSCMVLQGWSFGTELNCKPLDNSLFDHQFNWGQWNFPQQETTLQTPEVRGFKPYIKCPENVVILLHPGEQKTHVTLQRPETNLRKGHLVAYPAWAGQLQGHLPAGVHKVDFRVNDPERKLTIGCHTIITVKAAQSEESNPFSYSSRPRSSLPRPAPFGTLSTSSLAAFPSSLSTTNSQSSTYSGLEPLFPNTAPKPNPFPTFSNHISRSEFPSHSSTDFQSVSYSGLKPLFPDTAPKSNPFPTFSTHSSIPQPQFPVQSSSDQSSLYSKLEPFSQESAKIINSSPASGENSRVDLGSDSENYCPPSIEVYLKEHQGLRSVTWEEPRFEGKLLKIYKSHFPGALFTEGDHTIKYEATTTDERTLRCTFFIRVKSAKPTPPPIQPNIDFDSEFSSAPAQLRRLDDPGTYVICPDKEPVRVTADQSVDLPVGCTLKNVRPQSSPQKNLKRGKLTSLWHHYTHF